MEKTMNKKIVGIYSVIHFIVDLSCAVLVTNLVTQKMGQSVNLFVAVLIYNFFAFAMQLPIGIIEDKVNKNAICSAIGCLLVAVAYGFSDFGIVSCLIAGIGNSMFHVGGGIDVLNISNKKATLSGIFVSTGAMGIFLGSKSSLVSFNKYYIIILVLILSAILLFWLYNQIKEKVKNEEVIIPKLSLNEEIAIVCLIITVVIRSYVGLILSFEWKSSFLLALLSIFAVIFGKMLGGIIGDKIGFVKISLISLIAAAFLFIFAFNNSVLGILAILSFNMTMPITLTALSNILPNNKGMAFGLLTLALFVGFVPTCFGDTKAIFTPLGLFLITIFSAVVLYIGIKKYIKFMEQKV
jgi:FSR family fosmidomycin resistance protein-like MFS transporter